MPTHGGDLSPPNPGFSLLRQQELIEDLSFAWRSAQRAEINSWVGDVVQVFGRVTIRRGRNILRLGAWIVKEVVHGIQGAADAHQKGNLEKHAADRGRAHGNAVRNAWKNAKDQFQVLHSAIKENPRETLPHAIVGALAFVAASGGPDGNGGVPDLDLNLGIEAHRSIFFHSFFAGVVVETLLYALASGIGVLHRHLPSAHDPLWDAVAKNKDAYLTAAAQGAGAGIAYHLFIDATVQPGAFHDLPLAMPMEAHQVAMGTSAVVEASDIREKRRTFSRK